MKRQNLISKSINGTAVISTLLSHGPVFPFSKDYSDKAKEIFEKAIIIDGLTFGRNWDEDAEYAALEESGLDGFHATLLPRRTLEESARGLAAWQNRIDQYPEKFLLAESSNDFLESKKQGKVAVMFGFKQDEVEKIMGLNWVNYYRDILG